jgi:hypothetical protein
MLDSIIPTPRLLEIDRVELAAPPEQVWQLLRHGDFASSPLVRALFALRAVPDRLRGKHVGARLRLDDLQSSPAQPGFQILAEEQPLQVVVGAIGKVWRPEIPFVHVENSTEFAAFRDPGFVKVAWAIRVTKHGEHGSRVEFELRVDATDHDSWRNFQRYFRLIGPASHFIRRAALAGLAKQLGTPDSEEEDRAFPGDDLLSDASAR